MCSACSLVGLAGYIILIASRNATLSYIGVYLAACGIYPNIPNTIAWVSNNVEGSYKRSVTLAMVISFGNINGAVSSNVVSTPPPSHHSLDGYSLTRRTVPRER